MFLRKFEKKKTDKYFRNGKYANKIYRYISLGIRSTKNKGKMSLSLNHLFFESLKHTA